MLETMAWGTSADEDELFALDAMRRATPGMEASGQRVRAASAGGAQKGITLSPEQFNEAYNIYVDP